MSIASPILVVAKQTGSLIENISSTASIQLSSSVADFKISFVDANLLAAGWVKADDNVSFSRTGLYGTATVDTLTGKVSYALDNSLEATNKLAGGALVKDSFILPETLAGNN